MYTKNMVRLNQLFFFSGTYSSSISGFVNAAGTSFSATRQWLHEAGFLGLLKYGYAKTIVPYRGAQGSGTISTGVYFGSGSTPAKLDDYTLEIPITSGLKISNPSSEMYKKDGDKYFYLADFVLRNTSSSDITVSEAGLFVPLYNGSWPADQNSYYVKAYSTMIDRTVLDTPVVIPAGEARLFTYKFTFDQGVTP